MRSCIVRNVTGNHRNSLLLSLAAGLALLAPAAARADGTAPAYKSELIVQSGDQAGDVAIPARYNLFMGGLSDTGQIIFNAGMLDRGRPDLLIQYAGGKFTPIVMPATGPASAWPGDVYWPKDVTLAMPLSVNGSGNAVFAAARAYGSNPWGTFMWNAATGHTVPVALKEMPATSNLTFTQPGGYAPAINSSNEIALIGRVKDPAGKLGYGLFRSGRDGVLEPVARPHEELPGGSRINIDAFPMPSIDDSGSVAFLARQEGSTKLNAYLWVHDAVTPILTVGAPGPVGDKFTAIKGVFLNSRNAWALVVASTDRAGSSRYGLYRVVNGQSHVVAAPDQEMPGGGKLKTVQYLPTSDGNSVPSVGVSPANSLGEHVFLATLDDGTLAVYKIDSNGGLAPVLKGSFNTKPVHITATAPLMTFVPGSRPSINRRGQIALSVRYTGGADMIVLLTPTGS